MGDGRTRAGANGALRQPQSIQRKASNILPVQLEARVDALLSALNTPQKAITFLALDDQFCTPAMIRERVAARIATTQDEAITLPTRSTFRAYLESLSKSGFAQHAPATFTSVQGDSRTGRGYRRSTEGTMHAGIAHAVLMVGAELHKRYNISLNSVLGTSATSSIEQRHSPYTTLRILEAATNWKGEYREMARQLAVSERTIKNRLNTLQDLNLVLTSSSRTQGNWYRARPEYSDALLADASRDAVKSALAPVFTRGISDMTLLLGTGIGERKVRQVIAEYVNNGWLQASFTTGRPSEIYHMGGAGILLVLLRAVRQSASGIPQLRTATREQERTALRSSLENSTYAARSLIHNETITNTILEAGHPLTAETIRDTLGWHYSTTQTRLHRLVENGKLIVNSNTREYSVNG